MASQSKHVKPLDGPDKPPQAAYEKWAQITGDTTTWNQLTTAQQANWGAIAQAAINANG